MPISTFLLHRDRYKIDRTYQRESGTWKKADEQYFIDTILRGFGMPPVFLHKKDGKQFIVDGQQRLNTIWKFKDEKLVLSDKYSNGIIVEHERINKVLGIRSYFCNPFPSWEKGSVEHAVGIIRRFSPKKTDFAIISHYQVRKIENLLNNRPRKCLIFQTPKEVINSNVALTG